MFQVFTIEAYVVASGAVAQFLHARLFGAVIAAEHPAALLQPVADNAHAAMRAGGRESMDRAFKAVKRVGLALRNHLKGFVVVVAARVAFHRDATQATRRRRDGPAALQFQQELGWLPANHDRGAVG